MKIVFIGQYKENNLKPEVSMTSKSWLVLDYAHRWGERVNPKKD